MAFHHCRRSCLLVVPLHFSGHNGIGTITLLFVPHLRWTALVSAGRELKLSQQSSLSTMAFTTVGALACSLFRYTSAGTTASGLHKLCWAQQSSRSTMALRHCRHSCFPVVPQYFSWHTSSGPPLNCTRRNKLAFKPLSRATRARSHSPALLASRRTSCESALTAQASLRVVIRAQ